MLFMETKQSNELNQNLIQKKSDECLKEYQKEIELKKRQLAQYEQKQLELLKQIKTFNGEINELKKFNLSLIEQLNELKVSFNEQLVQIKSTFNQSLQHVFDVELKNLKDNYLKEKFNLETQFELQKKQYTAEKTMLQHEKYELQANMRDLEAKLEEIIKEKAQLTLKCGQLADTSRNLNQILQENERHNDQKFIELKEKLDFYVYKCNDLEKEISECQENHTRESEEWKKFQADLQTAVRVANDFMNGE